VITAVTYQTRVKFRFNGKKQYELSNHLGNVLVTISDRRTAYCNESRSTLSYNAVVLSANDYYAFGSVMIGRQFVADTANKYRYSFNGKETDSESDLQDYGYRIYNPYLCRFLSVDPLLKTYPMLTPFQFSSNSPISLIDLDGLEGRDPDENSGEKANSTDAPDVTTPGLKMGDISSDGKWLFLTNDDKTPKSGWVPVPTTGQVDKIFKNVKEGIQEAKDQHGNGLAVQNLENWLYGKGDKVIEESTKDSRTVQEGIETNMERFIVKPNSQGKSLFSLASSLNEGESIEFKDNWEYTCVFNAVTEQDLAFGWGTATLTSHGVFQLKKENGVTTVTGNITHNLYDNYNWNFGGSTMLPRWTKVQDNDLLLLEVYKGAKPFKANLNWKLPFSTTF